MMHKSPWIGSLNASGCNGCMLEYLAALSPKYDLDRFGCLVKISARHADVLLVNGAVNKKMKKPLLEIYAQMKEPKYVVAVGSCAISGTLFRSSYNFAGPLDSLVPVSVYIPGCPPRPESIIHGVMKVLKDAEANNP
ncbi:MAG: NADH-quinone oxidoreductase subunit NuoB [Candidatus Micrarchaeota archaeon]